MFYNENVSIIHSSTLFGTDLFVYLFPNSFRVLIYTYVFYC